MLNNFYWIFFFPIMELNVGSIFIVYITLKLVIWAIG